MSAGRVLPGQVLTGVVSRTAPFGVVFVDLGAAEAMINLPELSWMPVRDPCDVVEVGEQITVKVLDVDPRRGRISLSLKALGPDPLDTFRRDHRPGTVLSGTVTKLTPIGPFVRVPDGFEGLVRLPAGHSSAQSPPARPIEVGDRIDVVLLEVDREHRRLLFALVV